MRRIVSTAFATLLLVLTATSSEAARQTRVKYVVPIPYMKAIEVDCDVKVVTAIRALESIEDWSLGSGQDYSVVRSRADRRTIRLQPKVAKPALTTFQFLAGGQWFTLELRRATPPTKPITDVIFVPTKHDIPTEEPIAALLPSNRTPVQDYLAVVASEKFVSHSASLQWQDQGQHIEVAINSMRVSGEDLIFRFEMHNHGDYPYPIAGVAMTDLPGREHETVAFPRELDDGQYQLEPGSPLIGAIRVSQVRALQSGWVMHLRTPPIVPSASFVWRNADRPRTRGPIEDRLIVLANAAGGATKLDDGIGLNREVWTSSQLLGATVLYGARKYASIEGRLDFLKTRSAAFNDAIWGAEQGTLQASETAGRVQVGGLLHTAGKRLIPYARAALGVQLSRRSTWMDARTESDTRSALIFGLGGGLNVRIGKRMVAGLSVGYMDALSDEIGQTFEAGVHLGASMDLGSAWH